MPMGEDEHEVVLLLVDQVMVVPVLYTTDEAAAEMLMVGANTLDDGGTVPSCPAGLESEDPPPHAESTSRLDSIMIDIFLHRLKFTNFMITPSLVAVASSVKKL